MNASCEDVSRSQAPYKSSLRNTRQSRCIVRTINFIVLCAVLSLNCDQGTLTEYSTPIPSTGTVSFSLSKVSVPPEVRVLVARLERQGFQTISQSVSVVGTSDSIRILMSNVASGPWDVTVDAQDAQGITRYSGKGSVTVVDGQVTQMYVFMTPTSGGGVQIVIVWGNPRFRWTMSTENPVLKQSPGSWDKDHYYFDDPSVSRINGVYHMWYSSGYNISISGVETLWVAHATSLDGIHWTKTGPVFNPGAPGSWRDKGAISPCVLYDGGIYKMWFVGAKNPNQYQGGIGYATSQDGLTWTVDPQPVIPLSSTIGATWDLSVVKKDNLYYLFMGVSSSSTVYSNDIVLMTSSDGRTWQNRGVVLSARRDFTWQQSGILPCEVRYDENRFKMFFTAMNGQTFTTGYAESNDGMVWTGSTDPPVLTPSATSPWSTSSVGFPAILRDEGKLKMWFSAIAQSAQRYQIGYAEQVQ